MSEAVRQLLDAWAELKAECEGSTYPPSDSLVVEMDRAVRAIEDIAEVAAQQEHARIREHLLLTYTDREVDALIGPEDR